MSRRFETPYVPSDDGAFRCEVVREDHTASVRTVGELDLAALPELSAEVAQLRAAGCRRVIFDLRELQFIDSSGLRFLLECFTEAGADGYTIALIPGPPAVQRLFDITQTTAHLPFVDP